MLNSKAISNAPWECRTCGELYLPAPEIVKKPTEIAIRLLRGNTRTEPECDKCGESFKRRVLEKQLKNLIQLEDSPIELHILYQIDMPRDLAYWHCPECGEPTSFYYNNRPRRG